MRFQGCSQRDTGYKSLPGRARRSALKKLALTARFLLEPVRSFFRPLAVGVSLVKNLEGIF